MANDRNFLEEIHELVNGTREKIEITRDEFLDFRNSWLASEHQDAIVGHAHHLGNVTYYYEPNHDEND